MGGETLSGELFDGVTATAVPVTLSLGSSGELLVRGPGFERRVAFAACRVTPPLGSTPRLIRLPDGATIETRDLELLAAWEAFWDRARAAHAVQRLAGGWRGAALALGAIAVLAAAAWLWGIPLAARAAAFGLPASVHVALGEQARPAIEELLDLQPTRLPPERQAGLRAGFEALVAAAGSAGFAWKLEFRDAPGLGANALALPSGTVLLTDQLVALAHSDVELLAVLAHELVHVEQRHGMRLVLQDSGVVFLAGLLLGDLASVGSLAASLPPLLARAGYSRDFEREADLGAAEICRRQGWGTEPLRTLLARLGEERGGPAVPGWLASHPDVDERIAALGD